MIVKPGHVRLRDMFSNTQKPQRKAIPWLWYGLTVGVMAVGLYIIFIPFSAFLSLIPMPTSFKHSIVGLAALGVSILAVSLLRLVSSAQSNFGVFGLLFSVFAGFLVFAHSRRRLMSSKPIRRSMVELPPETQAPERVA